MAKQNYNQMSNKSKIEKSKKVDKTSMDEVRKEPNTTIPENTISKKNPIGHVSNCEMLNIRSKPSITSEILTIVNKETKVEINEDFSTDDFYSVKVISEQGITTIGYAMKEYIEIE